MAVIAPSATAMAAVWNEVIEMTKSAQSNGTDPLIWLIKVKSCLLSAGINTPAPEFAGLLVSHICWCNNVPMAWKFLEKAIAGRIAPPLLVLALLSNRLLI